ncbi:MAG: hypothetical protein QOE70_4358 [Chthoniobacter sp.]|jgi:hypothetical protein|nr:hypothetical protein [Chthoniobacter sp.]
MSKRVHVVQLLCPQRHCVLGAAYEDDAQTFEGACAMIEAQFKAKAFNRWCELCQSRELTYEDKATQWATMQEAAPALMAAQIANLATRRAYLRGRAGRN